MKMKKMLGIRTFFEDDTF